MGQNNSTPSHWTLSAPPRAILQPCTKSSSLESLTWALRPAQSGTIWHLSGIACVTYARKCLPTRPLGFSWAPAHSHLSTAVLATCQHNCWALPLLSFNTTTSAKPYRPHLPGSAGTTWHCGSCYFFPRAAGKECSKCKTIRWSVITWGKGAPLHP